MWGSIFDAGKELAEKARKAAEELEKNLNESAGAAPTVVPMVDQPDIAVDEDALNDAWDDDDVVIDDDMLDETEENMGKNDTEVAMTSANDSEERLPVNEAIPDMVEPKDQVPLPENEPTDDPSPEDIPEPPSIPDGADSIPPTELANESLDIQIVAAENRRDEFPDSDIPHSESNDGDVDAPPLQQQKISDIDPQEMPNVAPSEVDCTPIGSDAPAEIRTDGDKAPEEADLGDTNLVPSMGAVVEQTPQLPLEASIPAVSSNDTPHAAQDIVFSVEPDFSKLEAGEELQRLTIPSVSSEALGCESALSQIENVEAIIESIMSDERSRKLLEQRFLGANENHSDAKEKVDELRELLAQREHQLFSKTEQITLMESMHDKEKEDLLLKVQNTKEEAKRRIQKAKEQVDAIELKLKTVTSGQNSSAMAQDETIQKQALMITELREEGEKLARKQAGMEVVVRSSKGENRELRTQLAEMEEHNSSLAEKLKTLELDYKTAQNDLQSARQGISQVDQLDSDLRNVREENEKRATTILLLEQEVKELKATNKELRSELNVSRKGAAIETEQERKRLIMEHSRVLSDMETKLQSCEREAAIREDALRVEIDEIRKRWQDAVRRADALSVDVQASTAPLMRQLESTNKQNRIRAAAWAELETQLRNEIETSIAQNETLLRECNEFKTKLTRFERTNKEYESELKQLRNDLYDKNDLLQKLQHQHEELLHERNQLKTSYSEIERSSNEGVTRVRSEMTRTIVQNEDRFRVNLEFMEKQLQEERNQKAALEQQLQQLFQLGGSNSGIEFEQGEPRGTAHLPLFNDESQQRLRQSEGQVDILADALGHLVGDDDHEDDDEVPQNNGATGSFAALEQLTSRLKASKMELKTLRTRLTESEKIRNDLQSVVDESRNAREKLPLFEQRIQELSTENDSLKREIQGLREDIVDVRELYRTQLNVLLEAQAEAKSDHSKGEASGDLTVNND